MADWTLSHPKNEKVGEAHRQRRFRRWPTGPAGQQRRCGHPTTRRVPVHHRRAVVDIAEPQPDVGGADHPCRVADDDRRRPWQHRQHRIGQRVPARSGCDGLLCGQRPRWPTSPRPCPNRSGRRASGSTRSARGRSRPTCGSAPAASRPPSPAAVGRPPTQWSPLPPPTWSPAGLPDPDEVANVIAFLASDLAANFTGADVTIDGGLITTL